MYDVFLSYSSKDRERLLPLFHALERQGWSVFWDHYTIEIGDTWSKKIDRAIRTSKCVIVVWSESSVDSEWVLEEANIGKQRAVLLPIQVDKVILPVGFTMRQTGNFTNWNGDIDQSEFVRLAEKIRELVEQHDAAVENQARREAEAAAEQERPAKEKTEAERQAREQAEQKRHEEEEALLRHEAAEAAEQKRQQEEEAKRQAKQQEETLQQLKQQQEKLELQEEEAKQWAELEQKEKLKHQEAEANRLAELERWEAALKRQQQQLKQQEETFNQLKSEEERKRQAVAARQEELQQAEGIKQNPKEEQKQPGTPAITKSSVPPEKPTWANAVRNDQYGYYADLVVKNVAQRFRWIEPGTFWMGSPESEKGRFGFELRHQVTLTRGFWLGDTACTQKFWQVFKVEEIRMGGWWTRTFGIVNPSDFKDNEDNPVENVSWNDVQEFIKILNNSVLGLNARLPTEAEWEYACRAGTSTPFSFGKNITPVQVNYNGNFPYANGWKGLYRKKTIPVKSLPANPWGLYEMHGNVREWCQGAHQCYKLPKDPQYAEKGVMRVEHIVRGGSWNDVGKDVRSAFRLWLEPVNRHNDLGFRLALAGH